MDYNAAGLVSSCSFGLFSGLICASLTAGRMKRMTIAVVVLSVLVSAVGIWQEALAYPAVLLALFALLCAYGAKPSDSGIAALTSAVCAFDIMVFTHGMISPSLEAYSYTLRYDFYYRFVHSPALIAAVALVVLLLLLIRFYRGALSAAIPVCVISLSLSAAATMILHMIFGQLIDYNAGKLNLPLPYQEVVSVVGLVCTVFMCVSMRLLSKRLPRAEGLGDTREFYMILSAIILMVIFYCCENTILNNYTSFDSEWYRQAMTILIVMMIITMLAALAAVCSYILRTRSEIAKTEHEMELTAMYRSEIKDMQQSIFDFKHDYIKIYSSMSSYIMKGEYDKLAVFFDTHITPLQTELFNLGDEEAALRLLSDGAVRGLVYSYVIKARKAGVTLLSDIREEVQEVDVPVIDLNRILGIFLDNAIEQAQKGDKTVCFAAIPENDHVLFVISNAAEEGDIEQMFGRGNTTKGEGHGRGLAIARKLCSAHDALSMHTYFKNGSFVCELYAEGRRSQ